MSKEPLASFEKEGCKVNLYYFSSSDSSIYPDHVFLAHCGAQNAEEVASQIITTDKIVSNGKSTTSQHMVTTEVPDGYHVQVVEEPEPAKK